MQSAAASPTGEGASLKPNELTPEQRLRKALLSDEDEDDGLSRRARHLVKGSTSAVARREGPGPCGRCSYLEIVTFSDGDRRANCGGYQSPLNNKALDPRKPIQDCSGYWPAGAPTLKDMIEQARLLIIAQEQTGQ